MTSELLNTIRLRLRRGKFDALLVTQPENRRYLSGYTPKDSSIQESSGALLIPAKGTPFLLTDSRFQLQAEKEAKAFKVELYQRGIIALLKKLKKSLSIKRLAFESHYTLYSTATALIEAAEKVGVEAVPLTGLVEKLRTIKTNAELKKIQRSVELNEKVFQEVYKGLCPGQTELEVAIKIETTMYSMGAEGLSFESIVAAGPNGAMPHAVPSDRKLKKCEPIVIDMGLILDGYCSDMTRTVVLGTPDDRTVDLFRLVRKAQLAGINRIKDGLVAREADRAARDVISGAGYGENFGHGLGHGVGLAVHEAPSLTGRSRKKLKSGMVVTVEPGIYIPGWGGIRLENMVAVTKNGCHVLNRDTTFLDI